MKFTILLFTLLIILLTTTASAEVIPHYATLSGICTIDKPSAPPAELSTLTFSGYSLYTGDEVIASATMNYYESGDEFYYELNSTDLRTSYVIYTLVYFNNNNTSPRVIVNSTITGDSNGNVSMSETVNLNENLVDAHFKLYWNIGPLTSYFLGDNSVNYIDTNI